MNLSATQTQLPKTGLPPGSSMVIEAGVDLKNVACCRLLEGLGVARGFVPQRGYDLDG